MEMNISKEELRSGVKEFYTHMGITTCGETEIKFLTECFENKDYRDVVLNSNDKKMIALVTEFAVFLKKWLRNLAVGRFLNDE